MSQVSAEWAERVRAANDTLRDENDSLKAELAAARRERDALKEALRTLVGHCDLGHTHAGDGRRQAYLKTLDDAREALEKTNE